MCIVITILQYNSHGDDDDDLQLPVYTMCTDNRPLKLVFNIQFYETELMIGKPCVIYGV